MGSNEPYTNEDDILFEAHGSVRVTVRDWELDYRRYMHGDGASYLFRSGLKRVAQEGFPEIPKTLAGYALTTVGNMWLHASGAKFIKATLLTSTVAGTLLGRRASQMYLNPGENRMPVHFAPSLISKTRRSDTVHWRWRQAVFLLTAAGFSVVTYLANTTYEIEAKQIESEFFFTALPETFAWSVFADGGVRLAENVFPLVGKALRCCGLFSWCGNKTPDPVNDPLIDENQSFLTKVYRGESKF